MRASREYFNAHANAARVSTLRRHDLSGEMRAPAIIAKDEAAYAIAMERAAMGKRKAPKVNLAATPWN